MRRFQLTEKGAAALGLLRAGAQPFLEFARRRRKLVRDLAKRGLVECREPEGQDAVCSITEEGARLLAEPPWECPYCFGKTWQTGIKVAWQSCKCGADHRCCKRCARRLIVVAGQFPKYRAALKRCPFAVQ